MFNVAVCTKDKEEHSKFEQLFQQLALSTPYTFHLTFCTDGNELIRYYKNHHPFPFHFLILGTELEGRNGIETARIIRSLPDRDVQIIFLVSNPASIIDCFDVQAFQCLVKPVPCELFKLKVISLCNYMTESVPRFLIVKIEDAQFVLRKSDIIAIVKLKHSVNKNKLKIIETQEQYVVTGTLQEYSDKLAYPFLLIHRSVIVNLEHIRKFSSVSVRMSNQEEYPVGRSQAKKIQNAFARYTMAHL
ncbi:LytR/AlgR family response regulator transcription factor [Paenibacillus dendritiformis]|uniref:LytR/AlgR family response regulator transcription factor n=1 Tax=Paenibacillus dendritiformis TaxID=130049 RepID=UPI00365D00E3